MIWLSLALVGLFLLLIPTAYAGWLAAPFVPTRKKAIDKIIKELEISDSDFVVDLGCGSGSVLLAAKKAGAKVLGYELSPIMWFVSLVRIAWVSRFSSGLAKAKIILANFFKKKLPAETTVVFMFLMPKAMPRLVKFLQEQELPLGKYLVSYTFDLPQPFVPISVVKTERHGVAYVYDLKKLTKAS